MQFCDVVQLLGDERNELVLADCTNRGLSLIRFKHALEVSHCLSIDQLLQLQMEVATQSVLIHYSSI